MNEMRVRTWQERFRAGDFSSRNRAVQCEAGWYDWFCRDDALAGCLIKAPSVVLAVTDPFLLDNDSLDGSLYDDVLDTVTEEILDYDFREWRDAAYTVFPTTT